MKLKQVFALALVCCGASFASHASGDDIEKSSWYRTTCQDPVFTNLNGFSEICISDRGIRGRMAVQDLVPGDAYTVWWVYFDDPSQCQVPFQCSDVDFELGDPNADPIAVFGRMDSGIANKRGKLRFGNLLNGMKPSSGSQVWLLIFGHGKAATHDGRALARQLLTPEDPLAGAPHLGTQTNPFGFPVGVAVFAVE